MINSADALNVLLDLTCVLAEENTLEVALQTITDCTLKLIEGEHASVRLFDDTRTELLSSARSGKGKARNPIGFQVGEGIAGWVAAHGQVAHIDDTLLDPRFIASETQGFNIRSILALPLWSVGEVIGVIAVTSPKPHVFSIRDVTIAQLLANCTIPPIERARLEHLALTDHLTQAFNQRALFSRLVAELERARRYNLPLSIMLLDLDHFKHVNDTYGHAMGDFVLKQFAERMRNLARLSDVLVRRGGEEFTLIMPHTNIDQAAVVGERIRLNLEQEPFVNNGIIVHQTVSIGVATWNGIETAENLDRRVDNGMYQAKKLGRNKVIVVSTPRSQASSA